MRQRVLLVLGPHRSGSSLVAKALECVGGARVPPGSDWKGPDNPKGFFEPPALMALDDRLLMAFERTWFDPRPMPQSFERHPAIEYGLFPDARAVIRNLCGDNAITILKEPRLCRLLPFWRQVFERCDIEVMAVRTVRHPAESARSLEKRNGIPFEQGIALWLEHVRCCRQHISPYWPQTSILYDRMVELPRYAVERAAGELRLPFDPAALREFCREFLDKSLRHEQADEEVELPAEVAVVWKLERARAARGYGDA